MRWLTATITSNSTKPAPTAGHVPITEEFDSAKRTLPPAAPVAIALVLVAIVVGIIAYVERAKPVAQGGIDNVYFSQPANVSSPMVLIEVTLRNIGEKTLYIKSISASLKTDQGDQSDDASSASDYDRYFEAYPDLRGHAAAIVGGDENSAGGGAKGRGAGVVSGHPATVRRAKRFDA